MSDSGSRKTGAKYKTPREEKEKGLLKKKQENLRLLCRGIIENG